MRTLPDSRLEGVGKVVLRRAALLKGQQLREPRLHIGRVLEPFKSELPIVQVARECRLNTKVLVGLCTVVHLRDLGSLVALHGLLPNRRKYRFCAAVAS